MQNLRNKVQLIGRLGMDPEVKNLDDGKKLVKFSLATSEHYKDQEGKKIEETQWHNIVSWGNVAKIAEQYLKKGEEIAVEGKLVHRSFENDKKEKKYITEIVIHDILMFSKS